MLVVVLCMGDGGLLIERVFQCANTSPRVIACLVALTISINTFLITIQSQSYRWHLKSLNTRAAHGDQAISQLEGPHEKQLKKYKKRL